MKKKMLALVLAIATVTVGMVGCGSSSDSEGTAETGETTEEGTTEEGTTEEDTIDLGDIYVVSREEGSGTRGAFIELMGIEQKDESGEKVDYTVDTAEVTNSTSVMITTVQGNESAIGYISLGSYDESKVKAVTIDGVEATVENVKSGDYTVSRPFNIATKEDLSDAGQDFINFIMSTDGQAVIAENGYIAMDVTDAYEMSDATGKIVIGGSSSVSPVMEKLIEAYGKVNTNVEIELQTSDSSTGMSATIDGTLDIGMASRELKDSEIEGGLTSTAIALDGIAVIVNKENTAVDNLTTEQVMKIYTGEITTWGEIK